MKKRGLNFTCSNSTSLIFFCIRKPMVTKYNLNTEAGLSILLRTEKAYSIKLGDKSQPASRPFTTTTCRFRQMTLGNYNCVRVPEIACHSFFHFFIRRQPKNEINYIYLIELHRNRSPLVKFKRLYQNIYEFKQKFGI